MVGSRGLAERSQHRPFLGKAGISGQAGESTMKFAVFGPGSYHCAFDSRVAGVQAERTGVRACVANPASALVVTSQFICTRSDTADGQVYWLTPAAPRGHAVIMRLRQAVVTAG